MSATVDDGHRNRWKSARERDRNKARFLIRERLCADYDLLAECKRRDDILSPSMTTNPGTKNKEIIAEQQLQLFLHTFLDAVASGSTSTFSQRTMSKHFDLISRPFPSVHLSEYKIQTLCTSRFGANYAETALKFKRCRQSFTLMEYAALLGEYAVISSLLLGKINPAVSGEAIAEQKCLSYDVDNDNNNRRLHTRKVEVSTKVIKRLLIDPIPITLSTYIVQSVCGMKMWGLQTRLDTLDHLLECCPLCSEESFPLLLFGHSCHHSYCATCMWENVIGYLDHRVNGNVVHCPVCDIPYTNENVAVSLSRCDEDSKNWNPPTIQRDQLLPPAQKCRQSLAKYNALPLTSTDLKRLPKTNEYYAARKKNALHSSWHDAVLPVLGFSQEVRHDKFLRYVNMNAYQYVRVCLEAGVDIQNKWNEYHQTPLYIACWRGFADIVSLLLSWGAGLHDKAANGEMTVMNVARENGHDDIVKLLLQHDKSHVGEQKFVPTLRERLTLRFNGEPNFPLLTLLIDTVSNHPGAGAFYIDNIVPETMLYVLDKLSLSLPIMDKDEAIMKNEKKKRVKGVSCSIRSYFCDAEGFLTGYLSQRVDEALRETANVFQDCQTNGSCFVFPHMRFLNYGTKGGVLAPHVDLTRVELGRRSTHTFLLYLTDCQFGGETALLKTLSIPNGEGTHEILAQVQPRRGRLLVFPHCCPHEGMAVISTPKILIRGEILLENLR